MHFFSPTQYESRVSGEVGGQDGGAALLGAGDDEGGQTSEKESGGLVGA